LLIRVPPSEAQFADPESLSGVLLVVVVAVVVPVVPVVVVLVVGFGFAPARDTPNASAKPEATSTKSEPTSAAAASVLFMRLNLRIGLLSVVRATLRAPVIRPARLNGLRAHAGSSSRPFGYILALGVTFAIQSLAVLEQRVVLPANCDALPARLVSGSGPRGPLLHLIADLSAQPPTACVDTARHGSAQPPR